MPIIRKFAVQGHAVPSGYRAARGPFPPEIFAKGPTAEPEEVYGDSLHEAFDDVRYFRCRFCTKVLMEYEIPNHDCGAEE